MSRIETKKYRYKTILRQRLQGRTRPSQKTEAKIGYSLLNQMTRLGIPISIRVE